MTIATLIDANSVFYRMHYGMPNMTRKRDGMPVGALYGLARALINARKGTDLFMCAWDPPGDTFRHDLWPLYKQDRVAPLEIVAQRSYTYRLTEAFGLSVTKPGVEADDVIASVATQLNGKARVNIVSVDKDMMQLVDDSNPTLIWHPVDKEYKTEKHVVEKFGVPPKLVPDVQALMGDSTDGYPGLPKIGGKTAAKIISTHGPLELVYQQLDKLPAKLAETLAANKDNAFTFRHLARLHQSCYTADVVAMAMPVNKDAVHELFEDLEFNSLMKEIT